MARAATSEEEKAHWLAMSKMWFDRADIADARDKDEPRNWLTSEHCRLRAAETRELAQRTTNDAHIIMFLHLASTWDLIGNTLVWNETDQ
jgi:hypothetical protein